MEGRGNITMEFRATIYDDAFFANKDPSCLAHVEHLGIFIEGDLLLRSPDHWTRSQNGMLVPNRNSAFQGLAEFLERAVKDKNIVFALSRFSLRIAKCFAGKEYIAAPADHDFFRQAIRRILVAVNAISFRACRPFELVISPQLLFICDPRITLNIIPRLAISDLASVISRASSLQFYLLSHYPHALKSASSILESQAAFDFVAQSNLSSLCVQIHFTGQFIPKPSKVLWPRDKVTIARNIVRLVENSTICNFDDFKQLKEAAHHTLLAPIAALELRRAQDSTECLLQVWLMFRAALAHRQPSLVTRFFNSDVLRHIFSFLQPCHWKEADLTFKEPKWAKDVIQRARTFVEDEGDQAVINDEMIQHNKREAVRVAAFKTKLIRRIKDQSDPADAQLAQRHFADLLIVQKSYASLIDEFQDAQRNEIAVINDELQRTAPEFRQLADKERIKFVNKSAKRPRKM